jgi:hypothetical protein
MALVTFRSRAASAIIMYADGAQRLLELMGKPVSERGIITSEQIPDALQRLSQAVDREKAAGADQPAQDDAAGGSSFVSLRQRAYPLMQMLVAAQKRQVDVTWGV